METGLRDGLKFTADWTDESADPAAARLRIDVAGQNACRADNRWARSIDDAPHLSALPLAIWLASSWWRLCWENDPVSNLRTSSWRMAHEVAASGEGFLWPRLTFVWDGDTVRAECYPSDETSPEILRYISRFDATISVAAFQIGVDDFIQLVLERLNGATQARHLREVWQDVTAERSDTETAHYRRLEAVLGFDPQEAPDGLMSRLSNISEQAGLEATDEIATICNSVDPALKLSKVIQVTAAQPIKGRVARESLVDEIKNLAGSRFENARRLAGLVRKGNGIREDGPFADRKLASLLGMSEDKLVAPNASRARYPLGLAISEQDGTNAFFFRGRHPSTRRFEAARFFYDEVTNTSDHWHPITDAATARQKAQRAFSSELLAPIESLKEYLEDDFSTDAIEGAAEYFDVSPQLVGSHLANNGVIGRDHSAVPGQYR